ncbi:ribosome recycling factor [Candidatus Microgenomates bacterium]|nr:ribosome recycling factor [Candidatus Microgenomates bacterium]
MEEPEIRKKMEEVVQLVRGDIASIRSGRATPGIVQDIVVTTYGGTTKLKIVELASITTPDPRTIVISPWDKTTISDIKRAIDEHNIGISPVMTEDALRVNLPPMTAEDRGNFVRLLHQKLENGRIMVRRARADAMEEVRAAADRKEFGEDEKFLREERVQKLTDEYIGKIDELGKQKEEELLSV